VKCIIIVNPTGDAVRRYYLTRAFTNSAVAAETC